MVKQNFYMKYKSNRNGQKLRKRYTKFYDSIDFYTLDI